MAIKRGITPSLAEVGKIKTGYKGEEITSKKGTKFRPPKKLSFFMITTTHRDQAGNLVINEELQKALGDKDGKIHELKIRLPFDTIDKNFFTQYQAYHGGRKVCAGDGETALRRGDITVKGGNLTIEGTDQNEVDCDPETCPIHQANKCKVSGILSAFLPQAGNLGGVYKYRTHSYHGVKSILGALEFFAANTGGILQGLPLKLVLVKRDTAEHGNIMYATVVLDEVELHGLRTLAIQEMQSRKLIGYDIAKVEAQAEKSGFFVDTDPESEVEGEYYVMDDDEDPGDQGDQVKEEVQTKQATQSTAAEPADEKAKADDLF